MTKNPKTKNKIRTILLVISLAYLAYVFLSGVFTPEEKKILDCLNDESVQVVDMLIQEEKENGILCVATTTQNDLMIASLKKEKGIGLLFGGGYESQIINVKPNKIACKDTLKLNEFSLMFSNKKVWYIFCVDESAAKLKINGETVETQKLDFKLGDHSYKGYFWIYESPEKPIVEKVSP